MWLGMTLQAKEGGDVLLVMVVPVRPAPARADPTTTNGTVIATLQR
jgi:hypothetical protein